MIAPYLLFSIALFCVGAYGVLARRNLLIILMSLELMLNGINVALVALGTRFGVTAPSGQVFVLLVMAVAAAEVAVGLAIVISLFRTRQTVDTHQLRSMGG
jgi:NADH:ubiquinone oxidoreductase subunit K